MTFDTPTVRWIILIVGCVGLVVGYFAGHAFWP